MIITIRWKSGKQHIPMRAIGESEEIEKTPERLE